VEKGIVPEDEMVSLLIDIHLVDGYTNSVSADSMTKYAPVLYQSVFRRHHTDLKGFDRSLNYYSLDPGRLTTMYDSVKSNLERIQKKEDDRVRREALKKAKLEELRRKREEALKKKQLADLKKAAEAAQKKKKAEDLKKKEDARKKKEAAALKKKSKERLNKAKKVVKNTR